MQPKRPRNLGRTQGASGTTIYQGIISGEEYNHRLRGKNGLRLLNIMRKSDATAHAALQMVKLPILGLENNIKPALAGDAEEEDRAEFIKHQLFHNKNFNFRQFKYEALSCLDFGFSVAEVTYGIVDWKGQPRIGIVDLGFRKQTSIEKWETEDGNPGITQLLNTPLNGKNTVSIDRDRLILFVNDKEGENHEGISLLRYAFKDWDMKDKLGQVFAIGLEKAAVPTPVLEPPSGFEGTRDEENAIESIRKYVSNEEAYILKPHGWELDKFDLSGQSVSELRPALQYYNHQILLSVLGQFLTLGSSDASGSRAVSSDHQDLFRLSEENINRMFVETVQRELIEPLMSFNYSEMPNGSPEYFTGRVKDEDITSFSQALSTIMTAGVVTADIELEQFVRKKLHLPEKSEQAIQELEEKKSAEAEKNMKEDKTLKDDKEAALEKLKANREHAINVLIG